MKKKTIVCFYVFITSINFDKILQFLLYKYGEISAYGNSKAFQIIVAYTVDSALEGFRISFTSDWVYSQQITNLSIRSSSIDTRLMF